MTAYRDDAPLRPARFAVRMTLLLLAVLPGLLTRSIQAQTAAQPSMAQQVQSLTDALARTQAQMEATQRQLNEMRQQLAALQRQMAESGSATASSSQAAMQSAIEDLREHQAVQQSEIATHDQIKVESASKYPVKITGLLLLSAFANTGAVDMPATPTLALPGSGSSGATVRQTILGLHAEGPHLFGASSDADLRVDFAGMPPSAAGGVTGYTGYYSANATFLRLRTVHATLHWPSTEAYFALDRPIFSPDTPTSLTAVAEPALAWSGNLWTWNPQVGINQDLGVGGARNLRLQAALMDVGDAPLSPASATGSSLQLPPSSGEQSRWPGVEARVALLGSTQPNSYHFGAGGYFAPHSTSLGYNFDSWAGTLDAGLLLPAHLQLTADAYRGLGLGGLGGGAYKDFAYRQDSGSGSYYVRALDDVGGWAQLKERFNERLEFNEAFGMDNVFAGELRHYAMPAGTTYQNLLKNQTWTSNVIYSPSAYLLFSLEYRRLESWPVVGASASSNVIGIGAGYKF